MTSQVQFESFDIVIDSPPPYGFRLVQKLMDNSLVVSKLRQGGKAGEAGLKEGDILLAVNSRSCGGFNCSQALNLIDSASQPLVLTVKRKAGTHPKPVNQPVIIRQTNFLPKKKPNQPSPVPFKPSFEPSPEPPKIVTIPPVVSVPIQEKPVEPTKIFVGSTIQEPKEEEKTQKVEFGLKSSVVVEPPPSFTDSQKKTYTDSAFFNDPNHKYPTLEEQVQLARKVAMSVLAPVNANSKGHKIFMRAKERAWKYTTGGSDNEEPPVEMGDSLQNMPKKIAFVPKLPEESTGERINAMSNEELELMRLQGRKTTHTNVAPQVCFSLADDLKNMKGKGGKLFAKRQAKADSWTVGGGASEEMAEGESMPDEEDQEKKEREQKKVMDKLSSKHHMEKMLKGEDDDDASRSMGYGIAPINKLDSMVAANKAAMTPWQAAAEYGKVDKAFEHLGKIDSQLNNNLQLQQEPQRSQNVRPNSWTPAQTKTTEDFPKVRVVQARSPGYRPVKFPGNSIEPPAGIPISDA